MKRKSDRTKQVLVAILKEKSDFAILQEQGWYRIPVDKAPKHWPPKWLAFYQPKAFGDDAYRVRYYGEVADIEIVPRRELFPNEIKSSRSDRKYYRIHLKHLEELDQPIISTRPRRLVFIPTTWFKFNLAQQINDLFDDSPLEDKLWDEFKNLSIAAERQWGVSALERNYRLDFALFCNEGKVDIETDGDSWHARRERIHLDNQRDNDIQTSGWHILRFNGLQINESMGDHCLVKIKEMINRLGGLNDEGLVPRVFYTYPADAAQQLVLFESPESEYEIGEGLLTDYD